MISIQELLEMRGLDLSKKVKLVRHLDSRYNVHSIYQNGQLNTYQSYQENKVFECDYIVSFLGIEDMKASFIGVFKVEGKKDPNNVPLPEDFLYNGNFKDSTVFYQLKEVPGFNDFKDRVIIDWGSSRQWHQWSKNLKEVIEIIPDK